MGSQDEDIAGIISYMNESCPQLAISKENLLSPTPKFVSDVYSHFLSLLDEKLAYAGGKQRLLGDSEQRCALSVYCLESDPATILHNQLRYYFSNIGLRYFNVWDVVEPTSKRTMLTIRVVISYLRFLDSISEGIVRVSENRIRKAEEFEEYSKNIETIKFDMGKLAEECAYAQDTLQSAKREEAKVSKIYEQQHNNEKADDQLFQSLKKQLQDLVEIGHSHGNFIQEQQNRLDNLNSKIVSDNSVDALLQLETNVTTKIGSLKIEEDENNVNFQYKSQDLQHFEKVYSAISALNLETVSSLLEFTHLEVVSSKKIHEKKHKEIELLDKQCKEVAESVKHLAESMASVKGKKMPRITGLHREIGEIKEKIHRLMSNLETENKQRKLLVQQCNVKDNEVRHEQYAIQRIEERYSDTYKKYLEGYNTVTDHLQETLLKSYEYENNAQRK